MQTFQCVPLASPGRASAAAPLRTSPRRPPIPPRASSSLSPGCDLVAEEGRPPAAVRQVRSRSMSDPAGFRSRAPPSRDQEPPRAISASIRARTGLRASSRTGLYPRLALEIGRPPKPHACYAPRAPNPTPAYRSSSISYVRVAVEPVGACLRREVRRRCNRRGSTPRHTRRHGRSRPLRCR